MIVSFALAALLCGVAACEQNWELTLLENEAVSFASRGLEILRAGAKQIFWTAVRTPDVQG